LGQGLQHAGVLFEKVALLRADDTGTSFWFAFGLRLKASQPGGTARTAGGSAPEQSPAGHKGIKQSRSILGQGLGGQGEGLPQASSLLAGHGSGGPLGLYVAGEEAQDLAEGQVGVADAGLGVAVPAGADQAGVGFLGTASEFLEEGGLAAAGVAGDKDDTAPAS
jgi:hypothetical protein